MSEGVGEEPIARQAARVILLDPAGRTLLFRGHDPADPGTGSWWLTPGGGLEPGESSEMAARREVREETGFDLPADLGPVVYRRTTEFWFEGRRYRQAEDFYLAPVTGGVADVSGWTDVERRSVTGSRWWTLDELRSTTETIHPENLAHLIAGG